MNSEQIRLLAKRAADVESAGGIEAFRIKALQHLRLKTVIKESHCSPVHQMVFNHTDAKLNNLFATVGKDQATVYDDMHYGDYIGMVVHFINGETEYTKGGELTCCTWLNASSSQHPHGDALLALGCSDCNVSVISVVEARVVTLLKGHSKPITDICGAASAPGALLSLSSDGQVRLWDASSAEEDGKCVACIKATGAKSVALHPDGQSFVVGGSKGSVALYRVQPKDVKDADTYGASLEGQLRFEGADHKDVVECMRFLPGGRLAVRCCNGSMSVGTLQPAVAQSSWRVPGCSALSGGAGNVRSAFGMTPDGKYISAGNHGGDVYVYEADTGKRMATCKAIRVAAPVRACGISHDCRHVLSVLGNGYLFRYEYRKPDAKEEDKENVDANGQQQQEEEEGGAAPMEEDQ